MRPSSRPYFKRSAPNKGVTRLSLPAAMINMSLSLSANLSFKALISASERNFTKEPVNSPFSFLRTVKPPKPNFLASKVKPSMTLRLVLSATSLTTIALMASAVNSLNGFCGLITSESRIFKYIFNII